jgi:hypothetical protein
MVDGVQILYLFSCVGFTLYQNFLKIFAYCLTYEVMLFQLLQQNS